MAYNFLHTFQPQSIAFSVGSLAVHWYGICIVLGIVSGLSVALRVAEKYNIKKDDIYDVVFYVILGSLIGARIYAVLLFLPFYLKNPSEIIQVWHGGLAIHGAIIGGALTLLWYVRKKKKFFWQLADIFAPALALGQAVGRWGNYFNQELYGKPSDAPWAIPIELHNRVSGFEEVTYFHPTFLYESLMNFGVFLLLLLLHKYATGANHKPGITNREIKEVIGRFNSVPVSHTLFCRPNYYGAV